MRRRGLTSRIKLRHEIDWLDPEKLRACGLPQSKLEAVEAASQRHFAREVVSVPHH